MAKSTFVYVTYIRTTPEKLWSALTHDTEFMKQYWFAGHCESEWTVGSPWKLVSKSGEVMDIGEIVEATPPRRLVIRWQNEINAEFKAEGPVLCTMELEPLGNAVKLSVTHTMERDHSKLIDGVSWGWTIVVCNLKSMLETGSIAVQDAHLKYPPRSA
jgi:uncharacterized protein YndB with AHSA1/START domain